MEIEIEKAVYRLKDLERVLRRARSKGASQGKVEVNEEKIIIKCK